MIKPLLTTAFFAGFFITVHTISSSFLFVDSFSQERVPWNAFRFVSQSSKFVKLFPSTNSNVRILQPNESLPFAMAPLDDVVMGGASSSTYNDINGVWQGTVTDANNGGFIGIRSTNTFRWDASQCQGVEWEIDADAPRRLKLVLRDSNDFNGITWTTIATVKPGVNRVRIPFAKLVGARFAKRVEDASFQKENIVGVQITYSKFEYDGKLNPAFQPGNLKLRLLSLKSY